MRAALLALLACALAASSAAQALPADASLACDATARGAISQACDLGARVLCNGTSIHIVPDPGQACTGRYALALGAGGRRDLAFLFTQSTRGADGCERATVLVNTFTPLSVYAISLTAACRDPSCSARTFKVYIGNTRQCAESTLAQNTALIQGVAQNALQIPDAPAAAPVASSTIAATIVSVSVLQKTVCADTVMRVQSGCDARGTGAWVVHAPQLSARNFDAVADNNTLHLTLKTPVPVALKDTVPSDESFVVSATCNGARLANTTARLWGSCVETVFSSWCAVTQNPTACFAPRAIQPNDILTVTGATVTSDAPFPSNATCVQNCELGVWTSVQRTPAPAPPSPPIAPQAPPAQCVQSVQCAPGRNTCDLFGFPGQSVCVRACVDGPANITFFPFTPGVPVSGNEIIPLAGAGCWVVGFETVFAQKHRIQVGELRSPIPPCFPCPLRSACVCLHCLRFAMKQGF